jgi:hypothetical protein
MKFLAKTGKNKGGINKMAKNYYGRFQELISDTTIDDLLQATIGHQESSEAIDAVNEWVKQNAKSDANLMEFDDIFSHCLIADETLWFNLGWNIGWMVGVVRGLKAQGLDIPEPTTCLAGSTIYRILLGVI